MPRVYLIFRNRMFGDAIRAVLETHPEIDLVGMTNETDRIAGDLANLAPEVILLEAVEGRPAVNDIPVLLTSSIPFRLITLQPDADGMHIWSQTWHQSVRSQDLVEAILTAGKGEL